MRLVLAALVWLVPAITSAQSAESTAAAARNLYQEGIDAAAEERWDDAVDAFERSYELAPRAATLMNLGAVAERAERYVVALNAYNRFLATADERLLGSHGETAREGVARIEGLVGHLTIVAMGLAPDDVVRLDDEVLERASLGVELPVDPGEHHLVIERVAEGAPALECARAAVTAVSGARRDVELRASCPVPVVAVAPEAETETTHDETPLYVGLGIGGGVVVVGAVILVVVLATAPPQPAPFEGTLGAFVVQ